jgi:hypothetical protein
MLLAMTDTDAGGCRRVKREGAGHAGADPLRFRRRAPAAIVITIGLVSGILMGRVGEVAAAGGPPDIRTSATNRVPACVTPDRLMSFVKDRYPGLPSTFDNIAADYRRHGEHWGVRWDYAFFQMILETNYLQFRRANGRRGDVHPRQNNFAGLGATGGGVPGDSYRDVSTGVRAQIEHLVAYSGERVPNPVGSRTRLKQDDIIAVSRRLRRAVTFADLRNRWAADRNYARSIESVAERFRESYCRGRGAVSPAETAALPERARERQPVSATSGLAPPSPRLAGRRTAFAHSAAPLVGALERRDAAPAVREPRPGVEACRILAASYGGETTVLIRSRAGAETHYTLLTVLDGFEQSLTRTYVAEHAPGGVAIGSFATRSAAMAKASSLCR